MASFWALGGPTWKDLSRRVWAQLGEDGTLGQAAQLSFYFLLAMFPLLVSGTAVLGQFLEEGSRARDALQYYLDAVAPESIGGLVETSVGRVARASRGTRLWLGLLFAVWAGSSGVVAVSALNTAYEIEESRPWWKRRLLALALTLALLVLMMSALLLIIYGGDVARAIAAREGLGSVFTTLWAILQWPVALAFVVLAFNLLYLFAPNVKHRDWHWLMPGTVVGVGLWLLVSFAFKTYVGVFGPYRAAYGSIATVVVLLLWFYLAGIALLIGDQVNSEIEKASGKVEGFSSGAQAGRR